MQKNHLLSSSRHRRLDRKQTRLSLGAALLAASLGGPAWAVDYTFSCAATGALIALA